MSLFKQNKKWEGSGEDTDVLKQGTLTWNQLFLTF